MAAAAASCVREIRHKRPREDVSSFEDTYSVDNQDDQNLQKRSRHGLLISDFSSADEDEGVQESVEGEVVLASTECAGEIGLSVSSYEYLLSATDDQLGIPPSPLLSVDQIETHSFSENFWSDLFEKSSTESDSTAQSVDLFEPFLWHCYSYNHRDYLEYDILVNSDICQEEWTAEDLQDWALA